MTSVPRSIDNPNPRSAFMVERDFYMLLLTSMCGVAAGATKSSLSFLHKELCHSQIQPGENKAGKLLLQSLPPVGRLPP